jgi:hypothetical protein
VLALLADENFKVQIQTGLRRRLPAIDLVSVQDLGIRGIGAIGSTLPSAIEFA